MSYEFYTKTLGQAPGDSEPALNPGRSCQSAHSAALGSAKTPGDQGGNAADVAESSHTQGSSSKHRSRTHSDTTLSTSIFLKHVYFMILQTYYFAELITIYYYKLKYYKLQH